MNDVDRVVGMLDAGVSPTVAELERAAEALRAGARPGSYEQAVARWRIAVVLEQQARGTEPAPAVA